MAVQPDTISAPSRRIIPFSQRPGCKLSVAAPRIGRELARELRELALLASSIAVDLQTSGDAWHGDPAAMIATEISHLLERTSDRKQSTHFLSGSLYLRLQSLRDDIAAAQKEALAAHVIPLFHGFAARLNAMGELA